MEEVEKMCNKTEVKQVEKEKGKNKDFVREGGG